MRHPLAAGLVAAATFALLALAATPGARDLVRRLGAQSSGERDEAARTLLALGADATDALVAGTRDADAGIRHRSRALLAAVHDRADGGVAERRAEARSLVLAALREPDGLEPDGPLDRRLSRLGAVASEELAREARRGGSSLRSPDLVVALGRHASAESVATLAGLVRDGRTSVSSAVEAARAVEAVRVRDPEAVAGLRSAGAVEALDAALARPGDPLRRAAAALHAALAADDAAARDVAERLAHDDDARVRIEAARLLGRIGLRGAASLEELAADPETEVRRAALDALAEVPGAPRPAPAERAATDPDPGVRAAAARLLARDAVPASLDVLARLEGDASAAVRAAAARTRATLESR